MDYRNLKAGPRWDRVKRVFEMRKAFFTARRKYSEYSLEMGHVPLSHIEF